MSAGDTSLSADTSKRVPLRFPVEAPDPMTKGHFLIRMALFEMLRLAFSHRAAVGSNQFVYWNAADPRRCLFAWVSPGLLTGLPSG